MLVTALLVESLYLMMALQRLATLEYQCGDDDLDDDDDDYIHKNIAKDTNKKDGKESKEKYRWNLFCFCFYGSLK